ncbi:Outer membrane protein assembly factor BamB, contains PQQ-like beta-propeller repeat [Neorhodopirellula lusitana]|uniref:Outer membrane protein assembly factor BamB, contains PQQ-like beta-propeller repeat n=1 Tax=Neorhodopirellula lusitana TaxID=445327 RepID=A0ABY1Q6E4_9BACT|nr:PQQ-binding-like beta-propeller repeat protein [Neorhodopirellula lusitana]SMP60226.1 Outer membrane protein assembly factor BamB, contains PQQ-like beta-propeller repeat [Neorhodopirellula lusitana]
MKRNCTRCVIGMLCIFPFAFVLAATTHADWTSFRNGGSSHHNASLPTQWSEDSGIAWQLELDGYGQSAPVVHRGNVYTTSVNGSLCESCLVQCHDLQTGKLRWSYAKDSTHEHPSNYMNARAAPTPIVDDAGVYAFFETGDLFAVDLQGKLLWSRDVSKSTGKFDNSHGVGASLAQNDTHLFLNLEHGGPSFLTAIEKQTGESAWKVDRESSKSWSSPIVAEVNGVEQLIVSSGGSVTGYHASSGDLLWSLDGLEGNSVPSPTLAGNLLLVGARLPEFAGDGDVQSNCCLDLSKIENGQPHVAWRADKAICEYASPVVASGHAYFLNKANVLHCLDVESGEIIYRQRIDGDCWATPIVSDGKLYLFCKNGQCHVIAAGPKFQKLASNWLWDRDAPPVPETYQEFSGEPGASHGHGGGEHGSPPSGGPGGGMVARIKSGDQNGDGVLEGDEVPEMFRGMIGRIDTNADGKLDEQEIDAMAKSFAERRKNSAASTRDPIVYGVAASDGKILVRTGTRLFAIDN